jgi:hypothetical protein
MAPKYKVNEELKDEHDKSIKNLEDKDTKLEKTTEEAQGKLDDALDFSGEDDYKESFTKGYDWAKSIVKKGKRYLEDSGIKNILRTQAAMAEGYDSEKIAAHRASARRQMRGATQAQLRKLGAMHSQTGSVNQSMYNQVYGAGASRMGQFEENLMKANFEAKRKGQNQYAQSYSSYLQKDFQADDREEATRMAMGNTFGKINAAQKATELGFLESSLNRLHQKDLNLDNLMLQENTAWQNYVGGVDTLNANYDIAQLQAKNQQGEERDWWKSVLDVGAGAVATIYGGPVAGAAAYGASSSFSYEF